VEDRELRRSQRLLGLLSVTLEPPLSPLRRKLDQQGSFEATGLQAILHDQHPEESTVLDLEANALDPVETPTTEFLAPFIVPIQFYER
jgi:hypothetical protein